MRAGIALLLCGLASSARAQELAPDAAPHAAVGLRSAATRYGTSHETVYQLQVLPSATLLLDALQLTVIVPLSAGATFPTYCCRTTLGNATVAASHRAVTGGVYWATEASISAPTSRWSDAHASSLAATAALTFDAGYYLQNTTTLRAKLGVEVSPTGWLRLGATAGADYWLRHDQPANALVLPVDAYASLPWAQGWSWRGTFRTLARVFDPMSPRERFLHELSTAVAHEWSGERVEASIAVPLDESLRELGMLRLGAAYERSF